VNQFDNIHLLIIGEAWRGDESYLERLHNLSGELDIIDKVTFTGFRTDILKIMSLADLFVHCPVDSDSLPRVLLEAGSIGKAIVSADIGGVSEIVQHEKTGLLVRPGDVDGLSIAISRLIEDAELRLVLGQAAQENVNKNFSIEKHVSSIESIYNSLLRLT